MGREGRGVITQKGKAKAGGNRQKHDLSHKQIAKREGPLHAFGKGQDPSKGHRWTDCIANLTPGKPSVGVERGGFGNTH